MKHRVLVIDDEFLIRVSLREGLDDLGYHTETSETMEEGLAAVRRLGPDIVLLDNQLGTVFGIDYIDEIKKIDEDIQVVLMTAYGSVSQAVAAIKRGAYDYIQKPFDIDEIDIIIKRALEQLKSRRSLELLSAAPKVLVGESRAIQVIKKQIKVLAENDNVDLLVRGETGTGKEVVVSLIHHGSSRSTFPMVKINCGAIPENLLESELFGYEKGAFTGAVKTKKGLIELANGGTVFLDEIGDMPLAMQTKLLTFLEDRRFKRVGGLADIEVNVRVAAATNRPLEEAMKDGRFREDLFYRLNVMQIVIPPLRDRREDIEPLCRFYLGHFNRKLNKNVQDIDPGFLETIIRHDWKGNVRELKNILERAVLFCNGDTLREVDPMAEKTRQPVAQSAGANADAFLLKDLQTPVDLQNEVEQLELVYINRALELTGGNYTKAAELLRCTRFTLRRKLGRE